VVLWDTCNFDEWDAFMRAECIIQDCWKIITGTAPRPVQHPRPVVEEKENKSVDSSSSSSSSSKGKQKDSDEDEEREEEQKKSALSRIDSAKDQSGLGMLSPTGVILDDYAIPEEELGWRQDNGNRSNQKSKFDFLATRQCLTRDNKT